MAIIEEDPRSLSPVALAFIGDAVYELMVRSELLKIGSMPAKKLHLLSVLKVSASAQSSCYNAVESFVNEEELAILKRGRNANTARTPKSCSVEDYRKATAIEALFGYLHLKGDTQRLKEIFDLMDSVLTKEK